jgi:hypothetical protein
VYRNDGGVWTSFVGTAAGGISSVGSLPALPDASYPVGGVVYLTTDGKLYRNVANVWTKAVDGADITADSILTNSIAAGQVTAAKIAAGTITANEISTNTITAGQIAAGAIGVSELAAGAVQADKFQVGIIPARNLLLNGGFRKSLASWTFSSNGSTAGAFMFPSTNPDWTLRDGDVDAWSPAAGPWGSSAYMTGTDTETFYPRIYQYVPVVAGEYYSASGLVGLHRLTQSFLYLLFYDASGANVGSAVYSNTVSSDSAGNGGPWRSGWEYLTIDGVLAPANAVKAYFAVVGQTPYTSGFNWYLFMDQMWFGVGKVAKPYSPGESYDVWSGAGNVLIDASGVAITNGKITVTNPGATVIIDGTSNMFKIAASGSTSVTASGGTFAQTTIQLTGLGALAATPAHQCYISFTNNNSAAQTLSHRVSSYTLWGATTSGGSPTGRFGAINHRSYFWTRLDGSNYAEINLLLTNDQSGSVTNYGKYYILQETAI